MIEQISLQPRLTIVIPTLNRAYCVGHAIESALSQNYPDLEIIVSNNGSTDNTREVLEQYCDPRLRIIHREQTIPADAHGNFLLAEAKGEFFLGLSDDDYLEPEFAARIIDMFDRLPELAFAYSRCWIHYADVLVPSRLGPEIESGPEFIKAYLAGERDVCWCACVTRMSLIREIGNIPEHTIFGDMFYWTKLAFKGKVGFIAEPSSHYLFMGDNLSSGVPVLVWAKETNKLVKEMISAYIANTVPDESSTRQLMVDGARYLARSTANQFVWCSIRGYKKSKLIRDLFKSLPYLTGDAKVWLRVFSAFILPPKILRMLILLAAKKMAREYKNLFL